MNKNLLYFMRKWELSEKLNYYKDAVDQADFMYSAVGLSLLHIPVFQISTHRSKSIVLPVYGFVLKNGIVGIARNNFYNWKLSLIFPQQIPANYLPPEFITDGWKQDIHSCYCEGFHDNWVFPAYDPDQYGRLRITIELSSDYDLYTLLYLLMKVFPNIDFSESTKTVDDIEQSIRKIYNDNGVYELYTTTRFGANKPVTESQTKGYEILWSTSWWLNEVTGNHYDLDTSDDPRLFAEEICKYPHVKEIFLMQEYAYSFDFENI